MLYSRNFQSVDPHEFSQLMRQEHILLDVRTDDEYEDEHIMNAINIPLNELSQYTESLKMQNNDKPILIYCLSGGRSTTASNILSRSGCKNIYNLSGGIKAWNNVF